jgi:DNA polymerase V
MKKRLFALADCNNFYVSCERAFNPRLEGIPVAVMSNNDGCIVARSQEVKALGVPMGCAVHEYKEVFEKNGVELFSANFTLYGDMSGRVMETLAQFSPEMEIYSIDEAFMPMEGFADRSMEDYCRHIRQTVKQWTGIPVSIGIASTKTLAKAANERAKKDPWYAGVLELRDDIDADEVLKYVDVKDIWGIGPARSEFLRKYGINTALDLKRAPDRWVGQNLSIMGRRTVLELRGISCIPLNEAVPCRKAIAHTRSFGKAIESLKELEEAMALYVTRGAEKLRGQGSAASMLQVFIRTNSFRKTPQYSRWVTVIPSVATSYTPELIGYALSGLRDIYQPGYRYHKAGVIFSALVPQGQVQLSLFASQGREGNERDLRLMQAIDRLNGHWGRSAVQPAACGLRRGWKMRQEKLSPKYSTDWNCLPIAKAC